MARTRTTKKLAQRIDLNYFKRPTPLKRAKLLLSVLLPLLAVSWIAWRGATRDSRVYSAGRMSSAHAVLERECAACHVRAAGAFSAKVDDRACLACHDGPIHHAARRATPECSTCHTEHRGRVRLVATRNQVCAECHGDLRAAGGTSKYANQIRSLENGHPEFAALRSLAGKPPSDPGTIKLNHAVHLKPIRRGPNGPMVQLECGNCHRPMSVAADLTYADPTYRSAAVSYKESDEVLPVGAGSLMPPKPWSGRERMAPVKFANACAACHLLTFDKRFEEGVPHDKPVVIHEFLVKKFREYIAAHPGELRVARDPNRDLTGKPISPEVRVLIPAQWVAEKTAEAENLMWRKTCQQCHIVHLAGDNLVPQIAAAQITLRWMPQARFDHDAHRGFTCVSCHQKALTSTETGEILIPGIAICQTCHAPGPEHAESRCFECHIYHDWSKRKEVRPGFTLPALRRTGH